MQVTITFKDQTELSAEKNGTCYILPEKPQFPKDLSIITVTEGNNTRIYKMKIFFCVAAPPRKGVTLKPLIFF